jgi:hypothetical protein
MKAKKKKTWKRWTGKHSEISPRPWVSDVPLICARREWVSELEKRKSQNDFATRHHHWIWDVLAMCARNAQHPADIWTGSKAFEHRRCLCSSHELLI